MRINFFAGPCAGKSTMAAWLFSSLKERQVSVELVTEYVKVWATQKRPVNQFDQVYLFGKQMQYEYRFLSAGIDHIVTDSPTLLSGVYADFYYKDIDIARHIDEINKQYEAKYPSFNIFLERKDKPYNEQARYQTRDQAVQIDEMIRKKIKATYPYDSLLFADYGDKETILNAVLEKI